MQETTTGRIIERTLEFDLPVARVWAALTEADQLGSWFSDQADFQARAGYVGSVTWANHGTFALRVEEVDAPHRLTWRWVHEAGAPFDEASSTLVEWTLQERDGGGTVLHLRESGFATDKHHTENQGGWTQELGHLTAFLAPAAEPPFRANTDVAIHVADLDAAAAFYVDGLGLTLVERTDAHLEIDAGPVRLWVNRATGPEGFIPSFDVADRERALARLVGLGATLVRCEHGIYARDPFGNALDVIARS